MAPKRAVHRTFGSEKVLDELTRKAGGKLGTKRVAETKESHGRAEAQASGRRS